MNEMVQMLFFCVGVPLCVVPLIVSLVVWGKISEVTRRLQLMETRLGDTTRDWWRWANMMTTRVDILAGAGPGVGGSGQATAARPVAEPVVERRAAEVPVTPELEPPAEPTSEDRLKKRIAELRHRPVETQSEKVEEPSVPAATPVTTPHAEPEQPAAQSAQGEYGLHAEQAAAKPVETAAEPAPKKPPIMPYAARSLSAPAPMPAKAGIEAFLGMKLFVIIGAIALAFAGIFLVKMGIDRGLFDAKVRDIATISAGILFIALGQWRRRHEGFWSQGATAAGIVALFAGFFAATTLHHFLNQLTGFIALACSTALAVGLSLQNWSGVRGDRRGGILIGTLGLIGGYITPILIHSNSGNVPGLFGYLILLHVGIVAATRMRGWSILAALAVLFSSLWLIGWLLLMPFHAHHAPIYGIFLIAMVFSLAISTVGEPARWGSGSTAQASMLLTWLAMGMGLIAGCVLLGKSNFLDIEWAFFGMLLAGAFVLGRLRPMYEGLTWLSSAAVLAMFFMWAGYNHGHFLEPAADLPRLTAWITGFGLASVLAANGCSWKIAAPQRWTLFSITLAAAYLAVAYATIPSAPRPAPAAWGLVALGTAALFALLAVPIYLKRHTLPSAEQSLACYAHAVVGFLFIAGTMGQFEGTPLTALWSALLLATALAAWRLKIVALLGGLTLLAVILAFRAVAMVGIFPMSDQYLLVWNPIVWAYGSILLASGFAVWIVERMPVPTTSGTEFLRTSKTVTGLLQILAVMAGFFLMSLEVRYFFHPDTFNAASTLLMERGTYASTWLLLSAALLWMGWQLNRPLLTVAGRVVSVLGILWTAGALLLFGNPLWTGEEVGPWLIVNKLLYIFGLPALLCAVIAHLESKGEKASPPFSRLAGGFGFLLAFALVTTQVRQGFVGTSLDVGGFTFLEWNTYGIAWMTLGILTLAIGLFTGRTLVRRAGLIFFAGGMAYAVGVAGILANPTLHTLHVGAWPVLNHLMYGYGVPLALALGMLWLTLPGPRGGLRHFNETCKQDDNTLYAIPTLHTLARVGACVMAFILLTTQIRQFFQGDLLNAPSMTFLERATYPIAWLALGGLFFAISARFSDSITRRAGLLASWLGLLFAVFIVAGLYNPVIAHESVGSIKIFNGLLYAYGLPAAGAALLARLFFQDPSPAKRALAWAAGLTGLFLVWVLVSLEVQHVFRGDGLSLSPGPTGEMATYSLAWAVLGSAWLITGIATRSVLFRWASLVMMLLTIFKVFLFDLTGLSDMQRVLSLAGLGVSLMALAFIYHTFVFRREAAPAPGAEEPPAEQPS